MRNLVLIAVLVIAGGMLAVNVAAGEEATRPVHLHPHAGELTTAIRSQGQPTSPLNSYPLNKRAWNSSSQTMIYSARETSCPSQSTAAKRAGSLIPTQSPRRHVRSAGSKASILRSFPIFWTGRQSWSL